MELCRLSIRFISFISLGVFMERVVGFISEALDAYGVYTISFFVLSAFFLGFDIWQFFTSSYEWLAIVAGVCVLVSFLGHAGAMSLNATMYWLVCLTAAFLLALGIVPGAEKLWKAIGDFQISVLATVMSAVIPTVGAAFTAGVIWLKREIFN